MRTDVQPGRPVEAAPRRKVLRLASHDYAGGLYYVTQATQNRQRLFGTVINGRMRLSPASRMVHGVWNEIPRFCAAYSVGEFVVMPDHIHGIVRVHRDANVAQTIRYHNYRMKKGAPTEGRPDTDAARPDTDAARPDSATLFDFMQRFKSLTTARYRHGVAEQGWPRFDGRVWQREYYEHIVRSDAAELQRIREYIRDNPANANLLRFGALRFHGNRALLELRKTAFLASRPCRGAPAWAPNSIAQAQCVISGFLSPLERAVERACRSRGIPTIHVLACGRITDAPLDHGELLVTPFDPDVANVNAERAAWCNQYVLEHADEIVIGHLNPDGMLAFLLADLPRDTPIRILSAQTGMSASPFIPRELP